MTWILAMTGAGLVLWGVGVWSMCRARDEPQRLITVMRNGGHLLIGMRSRGETWMWVINLEGLGSMGLWLTSQVARPDLSLTTDDAEAVTEAAERYLTTVRSIGEKLWSIRT